MEANEPSVLPSIVCPVFLVFSVSSRSNKMPVIVTLRLAVGRGERRVRNAEY